MKVHLWDLLTNLTTRKRRMRALPNEKLDPRSLSCKVRDGYRDAFYLVAWKQDMSPSHLMAKVIEDYVDAQAEAGQPGQVEAEAGPPSQPPLLHLVKASEAWEKAIRDERITPAEEREINRHIHRFKATGLYPKEAA